MMEDEDSQGIMMELEPPTLRKTDRPRNRRRRRSSARFLRLTGRLMEDIEEAEEEEEHVESEQHLGDMYKRAIRMNAENRINATNSWNFRLIENIDKFLEEEPEEASSSHSSSPNRGDKENVHPNVEGITGKPDKVTKRVNFTKASCTLDASVKIYSYRVDDVHLTSYKVLANLNRTDSTTTDKNTTAKGRQSSGKESSRTQGVDGGEIPLMDDDEEPTKASSNSGGTLETNVANINMNKLDSAFDIDPLFHKMSKTFDEGGAKGLLLVNLCVGDKGCNIVFDSKQELEEAATAPRDGDDLTGNDLGDITERNDGVIDISSLIAKLDGFMGDQTIDAFSLVPQLTALREQHKELSSQGFVEEQKPTSRRYASTLAEEAEADKSIHQDALERSRISQSCLGKSLASGDNFSDDDEDDNGPVFGGDDFGGGNDEDDDNDFENFIALDDTGPRLSSISFRNSFAASAGEVSNTTKTKDDVLLDAICSGDVLVGGDFEYYDSRALEASVSGNLWAGAAHWKRSEPARKNSKNNGNKKEARKKAKKPPSSQGILLDLTAKPDLEEILRKLPKTKRNANPLQLSKAMITKYTKADNLLPPDAGIGIDKLSSLFTRPDTVLKPATAMSPTGRVNKSVCFEAAVETFGAPFDDGAGGGFGDDDEGGGGFALNNDNDDDTEDDFVLDELRGVRKVSKVEVGYATVAKKVDVKRLKRDLWAEIESNLMITGGESDSSKDSETREDENDDELAETRTRKHKHEAMSFQDTVREMEISKSQPDVTLPFYFICILHLANEKGLELESKGLEDFVISSS